MKISSGLPRAGADRRTRGAVLATLLALAVLVSVLAETAGLAVAPPSLLVLPIVLGGLLLDRRSIRLLLVVSAASALVMAVRAGFEEFRPGNVLLLGAVAWVGDRLAAERDELGVPGIGGGAMLLEIRDRLRQQSTLPDLPQGWRAEVSISPADGAGFSGDFSVSKITGSRLEVALVDVSGKGIDAGSRALLLSGALGGLLGAVPPEEFLAAGNTYLLSQRWEEGFATAVHLAVDLRDGSYLLQSAGHPPAAQYRAGSGFWSTSGAEGSALGVMPDASWRPERGRLGRGDALLLFTDGIVEVPGRDLLVGIDKLLGEANRLVISTFDGGAQRLVGAVAPQATDDRALILLWRQ